MFLQWNQGARGRGTQIALLHSVTNYVPSMGILESPLDNGSFALKGGITYRTITCATFPPENLHQIEAMVYDPTDLDIDTALAANLDTNLLGTLYSMNVNMNPPRVRKTIYLPAPFVGLLLKQDLKPVDSWTHLRGTIVDGGL